MARKLKPDWDGQGVLFAAGRSRRILRNGKRQNAETALMRECSEWMSRHPEIVVWFGRANAGLAWQGRVARVDRGVVETGNGEVLDLARTEILVRPRRLTLMPEGTPDFIVALRSGTVCFVECKLDGEGLREEQAEVAERLRAVGVTALVVHSVDELASNLRRIVLGEDE